MRKKILVISWFFPPVNSSEGLVTYKLLNNSKFEYDVFTQNSNDLWSYGNADELVCNTNINCIYSNSKNIDEFMEDALVFYKNNIEKYDVVMTRSMPEVSHEIGLKIKSINSNIIWIASFGDPIAENPFTKLATKYDNPYSITQRYKTQMGGQNFFSVKRIIKSMIYKRRYYYKFKTVFNKNSDLERKIINYSNYVICNNDYQKEYMFKSYDQDMKNKCIVLPHSYDEKLYSKDGIKSNSKILMRYIGHLDEIRTPHLLFEAIKILKDKDAELSKKIVFEFYGNLSASDKVFIIDNDLTDVIMVKKPIKYLESLKKMQESDWLIHIDANISEIIDKNIFFAAKLADYIGSKTKILGITMLEGASADILRDNNALTLTYSVNEILNYLYLIIYENFTITMNEKTRNKFSSKTVASSFDKLIEEIEEKYEKGDNN